jgi:surfeit locus 1 family protein
LALRGAAAAPGRRSPFTRFLLAALALLGVAGFIALGVWQLERRVWKLALIARVEDRVHAAPVAPPGPPDWPAITPVRDEYLRVRADGHFLNGQETLVQAVTDLGGGFWVLTPFRTDQGFIILVNRGFVPPDRRDPASRAAGQIAGQTTVTGLLRMSEPKGGFLRANDPAGNRWYSRDVAAIAATSGLSDVAPYFIDAEAFKGPERWPRGGLTLLRFPNNHLVYAITWFGLAVTVLAMIIAAWRSERRGWRTNWTNRSTDP